MLHMVVGGHIGDGSDRIVIVKKTFLEAYDAPPAEGLPRSRTESSLTISQTSKTSDPVLVDGGHMVWRDPSGASSSSSAATTAADVDVAKAMLATFRKQRATKTVTNEQLTRLLEKSSSSACVTSTVTPQVPCPVEEVKSSADQTESEAAHLDGNCEPCTYFTDVTAVKKRRARPCKSARDRWKRSLDDAKMNHEDNPARLAEELMSMASKSQYARRLLSTNVHVSGASGDGVQTKVSL
eukprot:TRINITY_DN9109_c0_g1_i6.p1 TRINITY_DN9109_c0_g1~~TRINITY_DN9109_c0_g1_i6.p1  ORF type:complete len:239 (+),score=50.56 TRINITY_DN9109_c0_g1_i6:49-765(+)